MSFSGQVLTVSSGTNVTIMAHGTFKANVSRNATSTYFVNAANADLVVFGTEDFCTYTTVFQTINSTWGEVCPPVKGYAFLKTVVYIPESMPMVSICFFIRTASFVG